LFGRITIKRAYYLSKERHGKSYIPLDEKLKLTKKHSPGLQYFLTSFTGREPYQESLDRFHEIFRPDGGDYISLRKALDMNYELSSGIEELRQTEIKNVFEAGDDMEKENVVKNMAVSIDATKVREKIGDFVTDDGKRKYEIGYKDAKIAAISDIKWNKKREEAFCTNITYVSGIEHADDFFKRIWVEMQRRCKDIYNSRIVFLGDGATWIWDRVKDIANDRCILILDFYHACENLSKLCKLLYGEETEEYWKHYKRWKDFFWAAKVQQVIDEFKKIKITIRNKHSSSEIQKKIDYFEANKDRMRYDEYRAAKLPIGSGTIESACKNVVGGRLKRGGMTWSDKGAKGMLQIRSSLKSKRLFKDFKLVLKDAA
jgi:hypothetical protein